MDSSHDILVFTKFSTSIENILMQGMLYQNFHLDLGLSFTPSPIFFSLPHFTP